MRGWAALGGGGSTYWKCSVGKNKPSARDVCGAGGSCVE